MNKVVYREPRTYEKYDSQHIIGFLDEQIVENYQPETSEDQKLIEPYTGYQYEGPEASGGTIMECTKPDDRGEVVNAIIRSRYALSEEMAIHRHHQNDAESYAEEWEAYNSWCETAKRTANAWFGCN